MTVIRIRTRETLCRHDVSCLILRAARESGVPDPAMALAEIARDIASDAQGLFIGVEEPHSPCTAVVGFLPHNAFQVAPTIGFAYSEKAPRQIVADVGASLRGWFEACGFNEAIAVNSRHSDRAFMVGLAHFGKPERAGSLIRFKF